MTQEFRHTTSAPGAGVWAELGVLLRSLPSVETVMACVVIAAFAFPIVTFSAPIDMNGINRAANQLSRKVVAGQNQALVNPAQAAAQLMKASA